MTDLILFFQAQLSWLTSNVLPFFILLGLLIFVHELGHYLVAVYCGVRVETFSLGFGKKIFSFRRGHTTYCVSLIPLGGYVKMFGDDPSATISDEQKKYSFLHQPVWPRIAIVLAGPLMNLFFAILVFGMVAFVGEPVPGTRLGDIAENTSAFKHGFRSGDQILSINNNPVSQWKEVKRIIDVSPETELLFSVRREGSESIDLIRATPHLGKNDFLFSTQRQVGRIDGLSTDAVSTMIGISDKNSLAAKAGLNSIDVIESINGEPSIFWRQLESQFEKFSTTKTWLLKIRSYNAKGEPSEPREISIPVPKKMNTWLQTLGIEKSDLYLLSVKPKSPAAVAGLIKGSKVVAIDDERLLNWEGVLAKVRAYNPDRPSMKFTILNNSTESSVEIRPELLDLPTEQGAMESRYAIGVVPALMSAPIDTFMLKTSNPISALQTGLQQSYEWSKLIVISFVRLIQNEVSPRNIGGILSIGRVASRSFEAGLSAFLKMMGIISINLFILNLLPVPVLDGGHLLFFSLEAIKGAPISFRKLEIAQQFGLVILLCLMLFALFNDITHLFSSF